MGRLIDKKCLECSNIKFRGDKCCLCRKTKNLEAHHILPQYNGGENKKYNIITLCTSCHKVITNYHRTIGYIK